MWPESHGARIGSVMKSSRFKFKSQDQEGELTDWAWVAVLVARRRPRVPCASRWPGQQHRGTGTWLRVIDDALPSGGAWLAFVPAAGVERVEALVARDCCRGAVERHGQAQSQHPEAEAWCRGGAPPPKLWGRPPSLVRAVVAEVDCLSRSAIESRLEQPKLQVVIDCHL